MKEQWKSMKNYEGFYLISNTGRIISLERRVVTKSGVVKIYPTREMTLNAGKDGYVRVGLTNGEENRPFTVHRLTALHFIKNTNPEKYDQINHLDGCKSNNNISNLEWTDNSGNQKHAFKNGLKTQAGEKNSRALVSAEFVLNVKKLYASGINRSEIREKCNITTKQLDRYVYGWKSLDHLVGL